MVRKDVHNSTVDLWCLGVLCYELLYGDTPFAEQDRKVERERIAAVDLRFPKHPDGTSVRTLYCTALPGGASATARRAGDNSRV
jgi:serine/threonine protein kinase